MHIHGHSISSVPQIKYLRVQISKNLKLNKHIDSTSSKASQTLGFLKKNLRINSSTVKDSAYKSPVRFKFEYCSTVWDPKSVSSSKEGDKAAHRLVDQLEIVQRRAARWVTGRYHNTSSVIDMLHSLDWRTLNRTKTCRFKAVYALQDPKQPCSNGGRQQRGIGRRSHQYR